MSDKQVSDQTTVQQLFRWILQQEKDYPCDLNEGRLQAIISQCFNLTFNQIRMALVELEKRGFITIIRADIETWRVEVRKRDWTAAPKSVI